MSAPGAHPSEIREYGAWRNPASGAAPGYDAAAMSSGKPVPDRLPTLRILVQPTALHFVATCLDYPISASAESAQRAVQGALAALVDTIERAVAQSEPPLSNPPRASTAKEQRWRAADRLTLDSLPCEFSPLIAEHLGLLRVEIGLGAHRPDSSAAVSPWPARLKIAARSSYCRTASWGALRAATSHPPSVLLALPPRAAEGGESTSAPGGRTTAASKAIRNGPAHPAAAASNSQLSAKPIPCGR